MRTRKEYIESNYLGDKTKKKMIETATNIGYVVIAILIICNLYYAIQIVNIRYNINIFPSSDRVNRDETEESITWTRK